MRLLLTLLAASFFWWLVLTKFNGMWRQRTQTDQGYLATTIWMMTLLLGVSMTLHIDPIQAAVGSFTGANNLGWYLAYMIGTPGFYLIGFVGARTYGVGANRLVSWLKVALFFFWLYFTVLYMGWLRHVPEWTARSPRAWPEMLFLIGFFCYAGVAVSFSFSPLRKAWHRQQDSLMRMRTFLGIAMVVLASICFVFKLAYAILGYFFPDQGFVRILNEIAVLAMAAVAITLLPLLVKHRTYIRIYESLSLWQKLRQLDDLRYLQKRLQVYCPSVIWREPDWWERVRQPDFYMYRTVVSILDSERILAGYLERLEKRRIVTMFVADDAGIMRYWDPASIQSARQLHKQIQIPKQASYPELLAYLRQTSQALQNS